MLQCDNLTGVLDGVLERLARDFPDRARKLLPDQIPALICREGRCDGRIYKVPEGGALLKRRVGGYIRKKSAVKTSALYKS